MYKVDRFDLRTPSQRPKERFQGDLMYKEVVFVYPVTIVKGDMGGQLHRYVTVPTPLNASVQVGALNGQPVDPAIQPNRIAHIFTRKRNGIRWHDKVVWKNINMRIEYVEEKLNNADGGFQYLYARALLLSEINPADGITAIKAED
jgi:hypothetical protein